MNSFLCFLFFCAFSAAFPTSENIRQKRFSTSSWRSEQSRRRDDQKHRDLLDRIKSGQSGQEGREVDRRPRPERRKFRKFKRKTTILNRPVKHLRYHP